MAARNSIIAIAGMTGQLGSKMASSILSQSKTAEVHAYVRNASKLSEEFSSNQRVKVFEGGAFDNAAMRKALSGTDTTICAYLSEDMGFMFEAQKALIDACVAEGVKRYIASDWSIDYRPLNLGDLPPKDPMILTKKYLDDENKCKISGVHVLNGAFLEVLGNMVSNSKETTIFGTGDEKLDFTSYDAAADYTAALALDQSATGVFKSKSE